LSGYLNTEQIYETIGQTTSGESGWIDVSHMAEKSVSVVFSASGTPGTVEVHAWNGGNMPNDTFLGARSNNLAYSSSQLVIVEEPIRWVNFKWTITSGSVSIAAVGLKVKEKGFGTHM
jgi:hypothetical protein